jgi:hypothetical protein
VDQRKDSLSKPLLDMGSVNFLVECKQAFQKCYHLLKLSKKLVSKHYSACAFHQNADLYYYSIKLIKISIISIELFPR